MASNTNKKKETPLNDILVVFLLLGVLGGIFQLIREFSHIDDNPIMSIISILLLLISLYGIYLILCLKKMGYWLLIIPKVIDIIVALFVFPGYIVKNVIVMDLGLIVFITLLMLLRKNGKNAFQLLWHGI